MKITHTVLTALLVCGVVSAASVAPNKAGYAPNTTITVTFSGGPGNAKDWIGIYNAGAPNSPSLDWKYVNNSQTSGSGLTSGSITLSGRSATGKYDIRFFANDGYTLLASNTVQVCYANPAQSSYAANATITVNFAGGPGNAKDWIGIFNAGAPNSPSLDWKYVNNSKTSGSGVVNGSVTLAGRPSGGTYDIRFFANDGYTVLATSTVQVTSGGWVTDFIDNFDGSSLDRSKWNVITGTDGEFNSELQWYVDEEGVENNFWVSNGELKIKVQKENRTFAGRTKEYTSARLSTKNKVEKTKGAWESKIVFWKSSSAAGLWPAFWLLGSRINQAPVVHSDENLCWPLYMANEIDIFEAVSNTGKNQGNFIKDWGGGCEVYDSRNLVTDFSSVSMYGYNVYRVEWDSANNLKLIVNGTSYRTIPYATWVNVWDCSYFAILNVAIGGVLGGTTVFGSGDWAGITVDYVKHQYWQ